MRAFVCGHASTTTATSTTVGVAICFSPVEMATAPISMKEDNSGDGSGDGGGEVAEDTWIECDKCCQVAMFHWLPRSS